MSMNVLQPFGCFVVCPCSHTLIAYLLS